MPPWAATGGATPLHHARAVIHAAAATSRTDGPDGEPRAHGPALGHAIRVSARGPCAGRPGRPPARCRAVRRSRRAAAVARVELGAGAAEPGVEEAHEAVRGEGPGGRGPRRGGQSPPPAPAAGLGGPVDELGADEPAVRPEVEAVGSTGVSRRPGGARAGGRRARRRRPGAQGSCRPRPSLRAARTRRARPPRAATCPASTAPLDAVAPQGRVVDVTSIAGLSMTPPGSIAPESDSGPSAAPVTGQARGSGHEHRPRRVRTGRPWPSDSRADGLRPVFHGPPSTRRGTHSTIAGQ